MKEVGLGEYNEQETFLNKLYYCGNCNIEMQKVSLLGRCTTCINSGNISKVNLISINKDSFKIKFKGHFCHTCGFYDYFDDFRISLEENNLNADILNINEINEGAIVKFISKNG